jgi:probable rRNA maturation factor
MQARTESAEASLVTLKKRVPGLSEASLARFLVKARRAAKLREKVSVLITGNRELQALNRNFRGKDKPTDVLSFPLNSEVVNGFAGDVAISADIAAANAHRLRHDVAEEIKILVLHGVLHLAGYDHENDHGEMARKEQQLRKALKLPVGLIERTNNADSCLPRKLR